MIYAEDSFFTLSTGGRIGLICLSASLALATMALGWILIRGKTVLLRLMLAVLLFAAFVWLSPQVYYAYYRVLIDGLPSQWVIGWPDLVETLKLVVFAGPANLSAHGQGVLFWALGVMAVARRGPLA